MCFAIPDRDGIIANAAHLTPYAFLSDACAKIARFDAVTRI
jgi:hypothetical protein